MFRLNCNLQALQIVGSAHLTPCTLMDHAACQTHFRTVKPPWPRVHRSGHRHGIAAKYKDPVMR